MFKNVFLILSLSFICVGCASVNEDLIPDKTPNELYVEASEAMMNDDFSTAREYLEAIDSRYPFGPYAHQVQLDLIYTYYKDRENDLALAEIDRFIRLNPSDENIDYLLYMRGLTNLQKGTERVLDFLHINRYDRDTSLMEEAFGDFSKLINNYPKSLYVADAYARLVFIRNQLAKHELDIAKFYYKKEAYISSARRCQKIIRNFKDTDQLEDAMKLLVKNYQNLGIANLEMNAEKLLKANFN